MTTDLNVKSGKAGNGKVTPKIPGNHSYKEEFDAIGEDVTALKDDVMSLGKHAGTDAIDSVSEHANKVSSAAQSGARELRAAISRNPTTSVLTAFAVGLAVNAYFKPKAR